MGGQSDTVLSALYAILNTLISIVIGFILSKIGVLTTTTRQVVSAINYYVLVPLYGLMYIMQAIDRNNLKVLGYSLLTSISTVVAGFIITLAIVFAINTDIRYRFAYTFVLVYQNIIVMPQLLTDAFCAKGAKYAIYPACTGALVKPYCSLPLIYVNVVYWITVLPILQSEKRYANSIKKVLLVVLNYYDSLNSFLSDTTFSNMKKPKFEEKEVERAKAIARGITPPPAAVSTANKDDGATTGRAEMNKEPASKELGAKEPESKEAGSKEMESKEESKEPGSKEGAKEPEGKGRGEILITSTGLLDTEARAEVPITTSHKRFITEFFGTHVTRELYDRTLEHFEEFRSKVFNTPQETANREAIVDCALRPEKVSDEDKPQMEDICTFDFYKRRILYSPPALWSIIGIILGFIFPFKEWLFDPKVTPLPTFVATLQTIGGMMSPISMFLLGNYISQAAVIAPDMFISWKHIIISNLLRNLMLPLIGLFWMFVVMQNLDSTMFRANPVLMFIYYAYWMVPNGIVLIAVYVVADYFAKEFAVISVYMNILSIPMMAIYMIIYFTIYES